MGTRANLIFYAESEQSANRAADAVFARMNAIEMSISDWLVESEVSSLRSLPRGRKRVISEDLSRLLELSNGISKESDGVFDVTCGALSRAWRAVRDSGEMPSKTEWADLAASGGWRRLVVHDEDGSDAISSDMDGIHLDFGGIGKGYAADEALHVLESQGIVIGLVELGGDMAIGAAPPGKNGWIVGLGGPSSNVVLAQCGVATSGASDQFLEIDGRRWSHLLDPRTGEPVPDMGSFTVVAPSAAIADGWASVAAIVGVDVARAMLGPDSPVEFSGTATP